MIERIYQSGYGSYGNVVQFKFDGQFAQDGVTADTAVRSDVYLDLM